MEAPLEIGEADLADDGVDRAVDLGHDQRQKRVLVSRANEPVLQESKRRHFAEHGRRFAVGDRGVEHQRALRFAGENAVHAVSEFVRERHHVPVGSQIIHQRVGDRLSAGQNVGGIERAAAVFLSPRARRCAGRQKSSSRCVVSVGLKLS